MGKFVMKETKNGGVKFDLKAGNGEVIATSEAYSGDAACKKGIESVRKNAVEAKLEDQTVAGFETVTNPKFEVYTDKAGEFRFRLKARNGEKQDMKDLKIDSKYSWMEPYCSLYACSGDTLQRKRGMQPFNSFRLGGDLTRVYDPSAESKK